MANLTIMEYATTPISVLISWKEQKSWPKSSVISYHVTYKPLKEAGAPVKDKTRNERVVPASVTELNITGLSSYTTYRVAVRPVVKGGTKMKRSYIFVGKGSSTHATPNIFETAYFKIQDECSHESVLLANTTKVHSGIGRPFQKYAISVIAFTRFV